MFDNFKGYKGNANIKAKGVTVQWTEELINEYIKCQNDPIYFVKTYMKLVHVDRGLVPFELYPYQEDIILSLKNNRYTCVCTSRQAGKSSAVTGFVLWYVIFHPQKTIGILANKGDTAQEILSRIQLAYEHLPKWLQIGAEYWNKRSFGLENGSKVISGATSSSSVRGFSFSCIIVDEAAHVEKFDEFFASVFPTISSGTTTKVCLISTPKGINGFSRIFHDAQNKLNNYNPILVNWTDVPGRDENWKKETLAALGNDTERFAQEFECVDKNTKINIRNKFTGEIRNICISELYEEEYT